MNTVAERGQYFCANTQLKNVMMVEHVSL